MCCYLACFKETDFVYSVSVKHCLYNSCVFLQSRMWVGGFDCFVLQVFHLMGEWLFLCSKVVKEAGKCSWWHFGLIQYRHYRFVVWILLLLWLWIVWNIDYFGLIWNSYNFDKMYLARCQHCCRRWLVIFCRISGY